MGRLVRPLVPLAIVVACLHGSVRSALGEPDERRPGSLAAYLRLAAAYRIPEQRATATAELRRWPFAEVDHAVAALVHASDRLSEIPGAGGIDLRLAETAVMMHVQTALQAMRERSRTEAQQHASSATLLLEAIHAAASRSRPGAPPLRPRVDRARYYLGFSAASLALGDLGVADDLATQGLRLSPVDARLLYVAGCVKDALAVLRTVQGDAAAAREARRLAEARLRDALAVAPDDAAARLRLGRVLLEQDRLTAAQPLLEPATRAGDTGTRYLAWLFLGELHERRRDWNEAALAYTRAMREQPDAQAARLALAFVLEQRSGPEAARPQVLATLGLSGRLDRAGDPWWTFMLGPYQLASDTVEALHREAMAP
ncbi:MAG TPA: hypothetical protein VMX54_06565 [Vicinamibacteria bacterium]|nr:hypothetical protein [Vicinamibacteria bacterium]